MRVADMTCCVLVLCVQITISTCPARVTGASAVDDTMIAIDYPTGGQWLVDDDSGGSLCTSRSSYLSAVVPQTGTYRIRGYCYYNVAPYSTCSGTVAYNITGPGIDCTRGGTVTSCADCRTISQCGWCQTNSRCMLGTVAGPYATPTAGVLGMCPYTSPQPNPFFFSSCPPNVDCSLKDGTSCKECLNASIACGWCSSSQTCVLTAANGTAPAQCDVSPAQPFYSVYTSRACDCMAYHNTSCEKCSAFSNSCGWCNSTQSCVRTTNYLTPIAADSALCPAPEPMASRFGNTCSFDPCSVWSNTTCGICTNSTIGDSDSLDGGGGGNSTCGWCALTKVCSTANSTGSGPAMGMCPGSVYNHKLTTTCEESACNALTTCVACSSQQSESLKCGWCTTGNAKCRSTQNGTAPIRGVCSGSFYHVANIPCPVSILYSVSVSKCIVFVVLVSSHTRSFVFWFGWWWVVF